MIRKTIFTVMVLLTCFTSFSFGQATPATNSADILLRLKKLKTLGNVLYFAAHPDDENTRLIAYLSKENLYRTGYLSLTRGDGGQNLIGNEQAELLGAIRTQELLAARRIDGGEQFFTRANDFGFCKNPEEAFRIWNKEQVLADAVWVIRNFKPDVIICRFPADSRAGHGHHTASAMIAAEAFEAAANPKMFPGQLKYVGTWQAKRLLWNTFNFGGNNTIKPDQFKLNVGAYNYLLGKGYGEIAAESRSQHKSQGFGVAATRGASYEYFATIKGDQPKESLMDGIVTDMSQSRDGSSIGKQVQSIIDNYNAQDPAASIPALIAVKKALQQLDNRVAWKTQKLKAMDEIIMACAGVWMEAYSNHPMYSPGQVLDGKIDIINRGNASVTLKSIGWDSKDSSLNMLLPTNEYISFNKNYSIPNNAQFTNPYWLNAEHPVGMYVVNRQELIGKPWNDPALTAHYHLEIAGESFDIVRPVSYKYTDPVKGEVYEPLIFAPPVVANIADPVYIFTGKAPQKIPVKLKATAAAVKGTVTLHVPKGYSIQQATQSFNIGLKNGEQDVYFDVISTGVGSNNTGEFTLTINVDHQEFDRSLTIINYDHIPKITLFPLAQGKLVTVNLKHDGNKIGYIPGAGDKVAESLRQVGYQVDILSDADIMSGNLQQYDAIITGVRAYNTQGRMPIWQPKLMDFVKGGGTLLVQYNVNSRLKMNELGPYPFQITRDRVTDEKAPVTLQDATNLAFNYPNKITPSDFDGWIQERGLYFTGNADPKYAKLFTMSDPDENDLDGATIVTNYGKGKYVYTSLSFFRQLPAGVPGAYRLFVNLISKLPGKNIANGQ